MALIAGKLPLVDRSAKALRLCWGQRKSLLYVDVLISSGLAVGV